MKNMQGIKRTVYGKNIKIEYIFIRKKVKNINLRVRSDGEIFVSSSRRVSLEEVDRFVKNNEDFIVRCREKYALNRERSNDGKKFIDGEIFYILGKSYPLKLISSDRENIYITEKLLCIEIEEDQFARKRKLFDNFVDKECERIFTYFIDKYYPYFSSYIPSAPRLRIRNAKSRWGSCTPSKNCIMLSRKLIEKPLRAIEYVVVHELSHFIYMNHSPAFYRIVASVMPDWKEAKNN